MLGGARSLYAMAQWGREHPELAQILGFDQEKTPCVATLHYLFRKLDVDAFENALSRWANEALREEDQAIAIDGKAMRGIHGEDQAIAIDGKAMRGIHGEELPGVRLVAAYAHESGLVLAQKGGKEPA
jgi:predicted nucleotidyltransferase